MIYRFLSDADFTEVTEVFNLAFSDYVVPVKLTEQELNNLFIQRHVDLKRSLGVFANDEMIGFTVNGFGLWNNAETVYDIGTGVLPSFRRQKIAEKMFEFMIPYFQKQGIRQYLLEVITENEKAFKLYKKLGFETTRKVSLIKSENIFESNLPIPKSLEVYEISEPDWNLLPAFWDGKPTWQNSVESIAATIPRKTYLAAFSDKKCVGYTAFSAAKGVIAQFAVDPKHRRKGVGSALLTELQKYIGKDKTISVLNLDVEIETAFEFLKKRGFSEAVSQFEMIKRL
jgi:ribosomal protein S18 acetylase RimI-like enzyme